MSFLWRLVSGERFRHDTVLLGWDPRPRGPPQRQPSRHESGPTRLHHARRCLLQSTPVPTPPVDLCSRSVRRNGSVIEHGEPCGFWSVLGL